MLAGSAGCGGRRTGTDRIALGGKPKTTARPTKPDAPGDKHATHCAAAFPSDPDIGVFISSGSSRVMQ